MDFLATFHFLRTSALKVLSDTKPQTTYIFDEKVSKGQISRTISLLLYSQRRSKTTII